MAMVYMPLKAADGATGGVVHMYEDEPMKTSSLKMEMRLKRPETP